MSPAPTLAAGLVSRSSRGHAGKHMQERLRTGPGEDCAVSSFKVKDYPDTKIKLHFSHFKILVSGRRAELPAPAVRVILARDSSLTASRRKYGRLGPVSYTHLTLPTIYSV